MTVKSLQPPNAHPFRHALDSVLYFREPAPLSTFLDPNATPSRFLGALAGHESVDLWFDDWPEARKRQMIDEAVELASIVGTRAAAARFMAYVDAEIIHKVSHPARFPVGRIAVGLTPINHKPHVARFLVRAALVARPRSALVGVTAVGRAAPRAIDREPLRRAMRALAASKVPGTAYSANFAHRVRRSLDDGIDLDSGYSLGDFRTRARL